ncbi:MAG: hypothetical protein ABSC89_08825 [Verrucomicrobiota bacterium]
MKPLQNRRSGFSAESRTLQFAGEMRRSADRRYDERAFFRGLDMRFTIYESFHNSCATRKSHIVNRK